METKQRRQQLAGKVAIITGAASGIGRSTALRFAREGASVVLSDINLDGANKVADEIATSGGRAVAMKTDVTTRNDTVPMARAALERFGKIDILANIAGGGARGKRSLFRDSSEEVQQSMLALNLNGALNCCHAVVGHMMDKKSGRIISIASTAGMIGIAQDTFYSAAKAGIIGFTKALAKELAPYGINVNCISPGAISTTGIPDTGTLAKTTLLKRMGRPEEVANVILFLASDEASYVTGQNFVVCGGRSLGFPDP